MLKVLNAKGLDVVKMKAAVEQDSEFVLKFGEKVVCVGQLEDIKEEIAEYVERHNELPEYELALYHPLKEVMVETEKNYKVGMDDNEYDERDETFILRDASQGNRIIDEYRYEEDALDALAQLVKDHDGAEDRFNLERKVEYGCLYTIDKKIEVKIWLPHQDVEVYLEKASQNFTVPASLEMQPMEELINQMNKIQKEINRRYTNANVEIKTEDVFSE